jgi:hypothetical protein
VDDTSDARALFTSAPSFAERSGYNADARQEFVARIPSMRGSVKRV